MAIGTTAGIVAFVMILIIAINNVSAKGRVVQMEQTYNALVYKVQSESCRDEFGFLNKEYIDEIQEWNESIVISKTYQNDFWLGIFYPDIYDSFETIDMNLFKFN